MNRKIHWSKRYTVSATTVSIRYKIVNTLIINYNNVSILFGCKGLLVLYRINLLFFFWLTQSKWSGGMEWFFWWFSLGLCHQKIPRKTRSILTEDEKSIILFNLMHELPFSPCYIWKKARCPIWKTFGCECLFCL